MADPRFFVPKGPFTLSELASIGGAELGEGADPQRRLHDIAPLQGAGPEHLSFLDSTTHLEAFGQSAAGACVVRPRHAARAPAGMALLLSAQPYLAYARMAQAFYPRPAPVPGIAPSAVVEPSARIGPETEIGPQAVIGAGVEIGTRCLIGPHVVVGPGVVLGDGCRLHAGVVVSHAVIGDRVTLHPGVKLGQDGFGFAMDPAGHQRVPQVGRVVVHDDCEIGANTTIDRGHLEDTVIGPGCWIDNLVQIGHNVRLGRGCVLVAQAGLSGSTLLGDLVALGGQVGVAGHLRIGSGAQVAAQSGVMSDVPAGARVCGSPAIPIKDFFRQVATLRRLSKQKDSGHE